MKFRSFLAVLLILLIPCQPILAWAECGHHVIASLTFSMLSDIDKQSALELLKSHPNFQKDFKVPDTIKGAEETRLWLAGRAGFWPEVAREYKELNRPMWHYQLGSSLVLGNANLVKVHVTPPASYGDATLDTQEINIEQAIGLCEEVIRNSSKSASDRALAFSWICHLVADAHQPCHAGSLYAEGLFPQGDRGANSIPTLQNKNMHALWDGLLGGSFDAGDVRRRTAEIQADSALVELGVKSIEMEGGLLPATWLKESRIKAITHVYTPEVLDPIVLAMSSGKNSIRPLNLSEEYLKNAGRAAQERAISAAYRLKVVWEKCLNGDR